MLITLVGGLVVVGCDSDSNPLAPYTGERELILQRVTSSARPHMQWVGGRVGAIGVNRGAKAALDTTLVWIMAASDNEISSAVVVDDRLDIDLVAQVGGTPLDSLEDGAEYTFWLAESEVYNAGLSADRRNDFTFVDTTFTLSYQLRGRVGGDGSFISDISIVRDQTLTSDEYHIMWSPAATGVRRLAIRQGSSGGFTDLVWDLIAEDENVAGISPPVTIGTAPAGVIVGAQWPDGGFDASTYTLWMVNESWNGSFSIRASGYAFFQIFSSNFE
ncbi:MAG: hypothetical protein KJO98_09605 [Rhodothermia bacterium]|nr:hypothetical protein [Rhodothermia bacterium]